MVAPFRTAMGDSPAVEIAISTPGVPITVEIAPGDEDPQDSHGGIGEIGSGTNAVDSNRVIISGFGIINSFGLACGGQVGEDGEPATITKRIEFRPDPGQSITLQNNPPSLTLLGGVNRVIKAKAFGQVQSDPDGNWTEIGFTPSDASPAASGGLISIVVYTASGPITIPPHATRAWIRMWGGSGASGAAQSGTQLWPSAGVGCGGYLEKFETGLTPGNTLNFTRGAGGVPTAGAGGAGTDSTLVSGTQTIAPLTAGGSQGTVLGTGGAVAGSLGGTASGGDVNLPGQSGGYSIGSLSVPGVGGARALARGPDGSMSTAAGVAGLQGGLIINWYADAV